MIDFHRDGFLSDVVRDLCQKPKKLNPKYFYDRRGSELFEEICNTEEYYLTRTELEIFQRNISGIVRSLSHVTHLFELGSGASVKTRYLLTNLPKLARYVPIDYSADYLSETTRTLRSEFKRIKVTPVHADFSRIATIRLPQEAKPEDRLLFFPGSTIGNFEPEESRELLARWGRVLGPGASLLIGVDLTKEREILEAAYNDSKGVTRDFNLNVLQRINRELGAGINLENFEHRAFFNQNLKRVEMHLVSRTDHSIRVGNCKIDFLRDETIHTENSYKYRATDFTELAAAAGFQKIKSWEDSQKFFSVMLFTVKGRGSPGLAG